jgi:hypothetical protein
MLKKRVRWRVIVSWEMSMHVAEVVGNEVPSLSVLCSTWMVFKIRA